MKLSPEALQNQRPINYLGMSTCFNVKEFLSQNDKMHFNFRYLRGLVKSKSRKFNLKAVIFTKGYQLSINGSSFEDLFLEHTW